MDAVPANSLERILSRRGMVRGHLGLAIFWSLVAAILLLLLLLDVSLILGLLVDRGRVDLLILPSEKSRFEALSGMALPNVPQNANGDSDPDRPAENIHVSRQDDGVLPGIWRIRGTAWGFAAAFLYRRVAWLQSNILALFWLMSVGVLLFVIRSFCLRQIRLQCNRIAIEAVAATRRHLHRQVLRLGPEDLDGTGHESATHLFTIEVEVIRQQLYTDSHTLIRFPLELVVLSVVLFSLNGILTLQWLAPIALGYLLLKGVREGALKKQKLAEDHSHHEEQILLASLKNARLTRGLGIEQREHEQFQKHLERYHAQLVELTRATDIVNHPQTRIIASSAALVVFLLFLVFVKVIAGGTPDSPSELGLPEAITFLATISLSIPGIFALKSLPKVRRELAIAADKIRRYLEQIPTVSQAVGAKFLQPMTKTLHFENVKYETPGGRKILTGVDLKLEVDKSYAIVSVEPLEAKAIAIMLPRFIEPREGRVMIDGEDIAWTTLESLRAETVFVAADDPPFEGTVLENIRGGQNDLSLQEVTEAAKLTHAHNFIVKLFNGYETMLTSGGDSLDAGQLFRLGLARAIARNPALLVIEEPVVTLDEDTKALLADAYDRICRGRTVIFLPARMSTVRRTDEIIVLYEGKVAAFGPHSKLVNQSPIYRHWEYLRFNEFRREA